MVDGYAEFCVTDGGRYVTVRDILAAMLRRWYVTVACVTCAVLLCGLFAQDGGVYTTRTVVTFMRPYATSLAPSNGANDYSIIAFAGAVATEVNNGRAPASYSTDDAPYFGAGVREGVLVGLPSEGNQWYESYTRAEIEIQIVGRTYEWVASKQKELVDRVLGVAQTQQAAVGTPEDMYIIVSVVPLTLNISQVVASRTAQIAAGAAMLLAAMIVSAWASTTLDTRRRRHRSGQRGPVPRSRSLAHREKVS